MKAGDLVRVIANKRDTPSLRFAGRQGYITQVWTADWPYGYKGQGVKAMVDFNPGDIRAPIESFFTESLIVVTTLDLLAEI